MDPPDASFSNSLLFLLHYAFVLGHIVIQTRRIIKTHLVDSYTHEKEDIQLKVMKCPCILIGTGLD